MKKIFCLVMCCLITVILNACSLFGESAVSSQSTSMTDSLHDSTDNTEVNATSSESDKSKSDYSETVSEPDNSSHLSSTSQDISASTDDISTPDDHTTEKTLLADLGDITVYILNDESFNKGEDVIYRHDDGDMYNIMVSYTADADITEFRILNFDESEVLCISGIDAEVGDLSKGESVYSKQYVNDVTISTGFSYVNSKGITEYYHFTCSMADDSGFHIRSYEIN